MKCPICGTENENSATICTNCGNKLVNNVAESNQEVVKEESNTNYMNSINLNVNGTNPETVKEESNIQNENSTDSNNQKKNNKSLKIILIVLAVLLVGIGGYFLYNILFSGPVSAYKTVINDFSKELSNSISNYDTAKAEFEITPEISIIGNEQITDLINKFSIKYNASIDYKNSKLAFNLSALYDDGELLNADIVYDNEMYIMLNNMLSKAIEIEEVDLKDLFKQSNNEDAKIVIEKFTKALNGSLKDKYFSKESETISVNGKDVKTDVNIMTVDEKVAMEMSKSIVNTLKDDDKFISAFATITNTDESKLKEQLKSANEVFDDELDSSEKFEIRLYTKGFNHDFVRIELKANGVSIMITETNNDEYLVSVNGLIEIRIKASVEYNKSVDIEKPSKSIKYNELSENDMTDMLETISNNKTINKLLNDLGMDENTLASLISGNNYALGDLDY